MNQNMLKILKGGGSFLVRGLTENSFKRFFLSNAYKCTETWENRLKDPIFSRVEFDNLYHDLDILFRKKLRISILDIDLLANIAPNESSCLSELEDVLAKLRLCPESGIVPERTTHAFIRWFMENAPKQELMNVLGDRIQYGMFPDYYLTNMMMDKFLKDNDAVSAVKIAVLQMLQEDFDHPIMKALALHCCYNYLASPDIWKSVTEPEEDPDEDVKKVRVKYAKNPYFDDHFDIRDTNQLVGKTLWLFGSNLGGSLGASSQLVGLVLYEKYKKCASFLENAIKNNVRFHAEAVKMAKEFAMKRPKQDQGMTESEEDKPEGESKIKASNEKENVVDEWKSKVLELLEKVDKDNLINESLLSVTSEEVKKAVEQQENKDIELQCQIFKQWEQERAELIEIEINKSQTKKLQEEISKVKEELSKEEQKLFYFDKEEEYDMIIEEKEKEKQSVVYYKGMGKHKEKSQEEYIPPNIR